MFGLIAKPSTVPDQILGLRVKQNTRARRMSLRVDPKIGDVILVWPKRASTKAATQFVSANLEWIENQRCKIIKPDVVGDGMALTVYGQPVVVEHRAGRGVARIEDGKLLVFGQPEHLQRRLKDFLKKEAEIVLRKRSDDIAALIDLPPKSIRVIDPKSRWGSCGPDGKIMYSWRIILAPPAVLDYLVAHETAHRVHMDHSRAFWKVCFSLCENGMSARRWLKTHGQTLMSIT